MTTKHTPGPWRLREMAGNTLAVYGVGEYDIVFPKRYGQMDADARLIAAAPETAAERDRLKEINAELLAALRRCKQVLELEQVLNADYGWGQFVRDEIDPAIAKATGEHGAEERSGYRRGADGKATQP